MLRLQIAAVLLVTIVAAGGVIVMRHDQKVVQTERARVERNGAVIDTKAQKARKEAAATSKGVLSNYYRD